jgi:hypothetical protein
MQHPDNPSSKLKGFKANARNTSRPWIKLPDSGFHCYTLDATSKPSQQSDGFACNAEYTL